MNLRYFAVFKDENCSDWKIEGSSKFYDLKLSFRHFSYTHYGLGFRYWLHTFLLYLKYAVKCRMFLKNPRMASCFLWKKICRSNQNDFKEHSVLQGFIFGTI